MDKEEILNEIINGSPDDNQHIIRCLDLSENEPDDLIRIYAKLWLDYNSVKLAKRLIALVS